MKGSGFSARNTRTTEYGNSGIDALPTSAQLRALLEDAKPEEEPEAEAPQAVEPAPDVRFASERFPSGIPSVSQLQSLLNEPEEEPEAEAPQAVTPTPEVRFAHKESLLLYV